MYKGLDYVLFLKEEYFMNNFMILIKKLSIVKS